MPRRKAKNPNDPCQFDLEENSQLDPPARTPRGFSAHPAHAACDPAFLKPHFILRSSDAMMDRAGTSWFGGNLALCKSFCMGARREVESTPNLHVCATAWSFLSKLRRFTARPEVLTLLAIHPRTPLQAQIQQQLLEILPFPVSQTSGYGPCKAKGCLEHRKMVHWPRYRRMNLTAKAEAQRKKDLHCGK